MGKGNMLLGMARGKVGSLVFSRLNGQQIVRAKADNIKNPRTVGQNTQRAIFATVAKAAMYLQGIVDHSFQAVKYGNESLQYFRKQNLDMLRAAYLSGGRVDLVTKGSDTICVNPYLISRGSLSPIPVRADIDGFFIDGSVNDTDGQVSVAALGQAYGIRPGDQLTVVALVTRVDSKTESELSSRVIVHRTVILDNVDELASVITTDGFVSNMVDPNVTTSTGWLYWNSQKSSLRIDATLTDSINEEDEHISALAIIVSRYDSISNKWLRSSQNMVVAPEFDIYEDGDQSAIDSYGNAPTDPNSNEYLNQAETEPTSTQVQDNSPGRIAVYINGALRGSAVVKRGTITIPGAQPTEDDKVTIKVTAYKGANLRYLVVNRGDNSSLVAERYTDGSGNSIQVTFQPEGNDDGNIGLPWSCRLDYMFQDNPGLKSPLFDINFSAA